MHNQVRGRARNPRLKLTEEGDNFSSPSYFEWCEQTVRTKVHRPEAKPQPKVNSLIRLFRRFT